MRLPHGQRQSDDGSQSPTGSQPLRQSRLRPDSIWVRARLAGFRTLSAKDRAKASVFLLFMWRFILLLALVGPVVSAEEGWFEFAPAKDPFAETAIDLRSLNERFAGE